MRMRRCLLPLFLSFLGGCGWLAPYRIDIQQGNFISADVVGQLRPGMTKEQVRLVLGTPLLTDIFHADRWDYVYWRETPAGARERRSLTVLFEQGQLARIDGDAVPSGGQTR